MNTPNDRKAWTLPESTPLTKVGSRSDNPDVATRNGVPSSQLD